MGNCSSCGGKSAIQTMTSAQAQAMVAAAPQADRYYFLDAAGVEHRYPLYSTAVIARRSFPGAGRVLDLPAG